MTRVERVEDMMDQLFYGATAFQTGLCTAVWVDSKASKKDMFLFDPSMSRQGCESNANPSVFSHTSRKQIKNAIKVFIKQGPGSKGPIGK